MSIITIISLKKYLKFGGIFFQFLKIITTLIIKNIYNTKTLKNIYLLSRTFLIKILQYIFSNSSNTTMPTSSINKINNIKNLSIVKYIIFKNT